VTHQGSCHCGRIAFEVDGDIRDVVECNCSHCGRKGYQLWFTGRDRLRLKTPVDSMATYTFNKHIIQHHFCPTCGCAPFGFGTGPNGVATAAINIRCLPDLDRSTVNIKQVDGRSF
jgi:hypothetical protein